MKIVGPNEGKDAGQVMLILSKFFFVLATLVIMLTVPAKGIYLLISFLWNCI